MCTVENKVESSERSIEKRCTNSIPDNPPASFGYVPPGVHSLHSCCHIEQRHNIDYTLAVAQWCSTLDIMPDVLKPKLHTVLLTSHSATATLPARGSVKIMKNQVQIVVQWELVFSNAGEPTSCMLYLEEASDDRVVSYPLHVHTSPVLNWSSKPIHKYRETWMRKEMRKKICGGEEA